MATSKAHLERLRRIKAATETVEDELNRLPLVGPDMDAWDRTCARGLRDAMHAVIRHLKARWGELNADGASDAPQSPETHETGRA